MEMKSQSLPSLLLEWSNKPFSYGHDCCQFACEIVEYGKGINPMDGFDYSNEIGAAKAIAKHGNMIDAAIATLGPPLADDTDIEQYDIVACLMEDHQWIIGVVIGNRVAVKTKVGIMDWPLEYIRYRWRV